MRAGADQFRHVLAIATTEAIAARRADGSIDEIVAGYANEGDLQTDGVDFRANTDFDFGGAGRLQNRLTVSYINKYEITSITARIGRSARGAEETQNSLRNPAPCL